MSNEKKIANLYAQENRKSGIKLEFFQLRLQLEKDKKKLNCSMIIFFSPLHFFFFFFSEV